MKTTATVFESLLGFAERPAPFRHYTSPLLWNDPHISKGMLDAHLDPAHDAASFRKESIDRSVSWMVSRFGVSGGTKVCDFGCGPGLWTTRLARQGARVTGIDLSERSIRYAEDAAKQEDLAIRYILRDYLQFSTDDRFDLITMIHGDFSVLSPEQRRRILETFRTVLSDGGSVLLDVASMEQYHRAVEKSMEYNWFPSGGFMSPAPHHRFLSKFKYDEDRLLLDRYTVIEEFRNFEIFNWNQCYSIESLTMLFETCGFRIVDIHADTAGAQFTDDSLRFAVIAKKKE